MTEPGSVSYVPIATGDGSSKKKGHARHFSDGALGDSSSWAPPSSSPSFDAAFPSHSSPSSPQRYNSNEEPFTTPSQQQKSSSLQDQVLQGTLELLKMAGGATLSTTGKLMAPPLQVTQQVLLPALWGALKDLLQQYTPLRVKDWFRIFESSVHHLFTVIGNTKKGLIFQSKLHSVGDGIIDCLSSDASRQAIMDGMAAWVKLAEALHTPETKVFLEQLSVLGCRLVDAAASGRNKQLLHNVSDAVWAGLELVSDPSSTLAFAEVTAYLCFALEMEDALHRDQNPMSRQLAAQRRRQRNAAQRNTYINPNMTQDANTTVEQVMLSSLGEQIDTANTSVQGSLPSNVILNDETRGDWLQNETAAMEEELNFRERASGEIDLQLLQEGITKRDEGLEEKRNDRRRQKPDAVDAFLRAQQGASSQAAATDGTEQPDRQPTARRDGDIEEIVVTTVSENDDDDETEHGGEEGASTQSATATVTETESKKTADSGLQYQDKEADKEAVAVSSEKKDEDGVADWLSDAAEQSPQDAFDGESAPNRFYRRLDEIIDKKRTEAVLNALNQQPDGQGAGLSWFPKAAAAAGAGNERGQDTIKNRVAAVRNAARSSQIGVGKGLMELAQDKQARRTISFVTILSGLFGMFWFAMGFYGCYSVVYGPPSLFRGTPTITRAASAQQEIVVRIVREVVHVDADGNHVEPPAYYPPVRVAAPENVDDVAACVAKAFK